MPKSFQTKLQYSSCSEDLLSEKAAFADTSHLPIIAITGGGGRPLGLLDSTSEGVWAVDFNPTQNALLKLKMHCLLALDDKELSLLFGLAESSMTDRKRIWRLQKQNCQDAEMVSFMNDIESHVLRHGLLFAGRMERHFVFGAKVLQRVFGRQLRDLFHCLTLEEQRDVWSNIARKTTWRFLAKLGSSPWVYRFLSNPGWYLERPDSSSASVQENVIRSIDAYLNSKLACESHLLQLLFLGSYLDGLPGGPYYLRQDVRSSLKNSLERVNLETGGIVEALSRWQGTAINLALSNVPSYLTNESRDQLWRALDLLGSGSVVCYRDFLFPRDLPTYLERSFKFDPGLSTTLTNQDSSIVYWVRIFRRT